MRKLFAFAACLALSVACAVNSWADEADPPEAPKPPAPAVTGDAGAAADEKQTYDLKYQFQPGETLRTEVVQRATVQTTIQGTSQTAETQSRSIKVWKIDEVAEDGTATFVHSVESIDMRQKTQGRKEQRYNSATDQEVPPGYEDAAKAVGVPLTYVTMDCRGKIIKRRETRTQPTSTSTQMTMPLPDHPIAIGESWSSPVDIDVTQKDGSTKRIQTRQKFTLEKVANDVATIAVDSQVLTPVRDPAIEAQLIQRLSSGTVRFDIAAGRVLGQQLDLDRHVIGFSGVGSSMHYVTRFTEQLLKPAEQASKDEETPPADADTSAAKDKGTKKRVGFAHAAGQNRDRALADPRQDQGCRLVARKGQLPAQHRRGRARRHAS